MKESNDNKIEMNELQEPSTAPSQPFNQPGFGIRELTATYEMLVTSKVAIARNQWSGQDVQAIAMLMVMLSQMESQYRSQLERAKEDEKRVKKKIETEIKNAGGSLNGETVSTGSNHAAS